MNYAAAAHNHIGRSVIIAGLTLAITALSDKTGKLKNGTDAPYLVLTGPDGQTDMLHPRTATTLFSKGEAAGVKLLVDAVVEAGPIVEAKVELVEPAAVIEVAGTSKKAQAIAIFNAVVAAHGTRAEVIKRFQSDVGLSLNGANTYYQNCRGGKWE
jgi:hypothetical protein